MPTISKLRIALGHQSRVGKDSFADHVISTHGGEKVAFSTGVYACSELIQSYMGFDVKKDPVLLQFLGGGLKKVYSQDIWIIPTMAHIHIILKNNPNANIIVSDLRHKNEMILLKSEGFTTIKITRQDRVKDRPTDDISETDLQDADFDFYITNDGTIAEFLAKVDKLITQM